MLDADLLSAQKTVEPTPTGWVSCTTDVSFGADQSFGAVVFKDHKNRIEDISSTRSSATHPLLMEAETVIFVAAMARRNGYKNILIYCDNAQVVNFFSASREIASHQLLDGARDRFFEIIRHFDGYKLSKIERKVNFAAHNCAKWARLNQVIGNIDLANLDNTILAEDQEWNLG